MFSVAVGILAGTIGLMVLEFLLPANRYFCYPRILKQEIVLKMSWKKLGKNSKANLVTKGLVESLNTLAQRLQKR